MASATGPSDARFETTAAYQATEASTKQLQQDVEKNAQKTHDVAEQAASSAQFKEPETERAVDELEAELGAQKTEGKSTVDSAKATIAGYVEQARNLASSALATSASYLPSSTPTATSNRDGSEGGAQTGSFASGVGSSMQSAAGAAVETSKNIFSSAQQTVQPHVDKLSKAIYGDQSQTPTKPSDVAATTAPLESTGGVVGGPYPETATGGKSTVGNV